MFPSPHGAQPCRVTRSTSAPGVTLPSLREPDSPRGQPPRPSQTPGGRMEALSLQLWEVRIMPCEGRVMALLAEERGDSDAGFTKMSSQPDPSREAAPRAAFRPGLSAGCPECQAFRSCLASSGKRCWLCHPRLMTRSWLGSFKGCSRSSPAWQTQAPSQRMCQWEGRGEAIPGKVGRCPPLPGSHSLGGRAVGQEAEGLGCPFLPPTRTPALPPRGVTATPKGADRPTSTHSLAVSSDADTPRG